MTKISAKIVADSKNEFGDRITTFVLTFPRYILAEFNTHRMISKNSASSRAIPFLKMLKSVLKNPFIPIAWMKDHTGMQGNEYLTGWRLKLVKFFWLAASKIAVLSALTLNKLGLTKQLVNRVLEPFMWHTVICTGTEYENFFALRASKHADIHIQKLAYEMLEAYNASIPKELVAGQWHIPFGDNINFSDKLFAAMGTREETDLRLVKIASARCARVSYTVVGEEGKPDNYENDIKLHDRLSASGHWSPFEHCARAMSWQEYNVDAMGFTLSKLYEGQSGNFKGFKQYRKFFEGENQTDNRVVKK